MALILAGLCAACYGAADFSGGLASRQRVAGFVAAVGGVVGLVCLSAAAMVVGADGFSAADAGLSAVGGLAGSVGVLLLYYGLAEGHISIVSPLTAVCSAVLPLAVGLIQGERPGMTSLVGVGLALVAVAVISMEDGHGTSSWSTRRSVTVGLLAGVGFGLFFVMLDAVDSGTGLWPVVVSRSVGIPLYLLVWSRSGDPGLTPLPMLAVAAGLLDSAANVSYLLATREGLLSLVAVVASLYPAGTVFLARVVLGERLGTQRLAGVVAALVAVALIAI